MKEVITNSKNVIIFLSIINSHIYQAACKITSDTLLPASKDWLEIWQGSFTNVV